MSPFSILLKRLRLSRGYRQKTLAHHLGYEASYLSAIERSEKGPPRQDFIQRLIKGLELNEDEKQELFNALNASRRQFSLPANASAEEYALIRKLEVQLGKLQPLPIQMIEMALKFQESLTGSNQQPSEN
ncbi:Helix-turn-helix domain-containing protein [Formivibrio citricus]|uniref:Helix-turn-helix domain-containing protein n=1 Tax=Formivibrio citricus TaxID=83765 RepID=A0A1I5CUS7_9NEIS|nr:helix-turn-helix transcriptional regulator [Formivibrio citricus]SFN90626.1 Helix-turn-helix domain-containing protein [Formivibrio citricus]